MFQIKRVILNFTMLALAAAAAHAQTAGTAILSSLSCGNTGIGLTKSCGTMTLTASGGPILIGMTLKLSGAFDQFTLSLPSSNVCMPGNTLAPGATCNLVTVSHKPTSAGTHTMTITVTPSGAIAGSGSVSGTGVYGTVTVSTSALSCTGKVGIASTCTGEITVTATNGPVVLGSTLFSLSGSHASDFSVAASVSNACTANQTLADGASCKLGPVTFTAGGGGTRSATITVTPSSGTAGSATLSGSASYGTAALSVSGVRCSGTVGIASNCSGTATITATDGVVVLNATPVTKSGSHPNDFAVAAGTCAGATLSSGSSCSLGPITFTAGATGTRTVTLTTSAASGTNTSASLSGTGSAAGSATVSSVACGTAGIGTTKTCSGTVTLTATGGAIRLGSPVYTVSGATTAFTYAAATTGACTAGSVLASGQSCNLITVSAFKPTVAGASTMTVTVAPTVGTTGSNTVSGVGVYGTALVAPTSLDCGSIGAGLTKNCGSFTITASGGQVQLGSPAFTNSNEDEFTVPAGTCTANKVLADGESCSTGTIVFEPNHVGASSATVRVNTIEGAGPTVTLSGTGLAGEANIIPTSLSCGEVTAGQTANCGTVTVTATGGPITFSSTPLSVTADFAVTPGSCTGGLTLSVGQSCTTGTVIFQPTTAGAKTGTLTVHCGSSCGGTVTLSGTSYTYSWKTGEWSEWSSTCSENATRTRAVFCERSDGVTVSDALCDASSRPADSETAQVLTTCTYSWIEGGFGACEGGHGVWVTGEWQPKLACGEVEQTRSVTCAFDVDSGSHSQTVVCRRSDGSIRPDEECDPATRPPTMKNCTPSDPKVCGERPEDTRTVTLDTSCVRDAILQVCTPKKESDRFCVATPL